MKKQRKKSWIILVLIFVMLGVLCFAVYQALSVYIPQQREQERFAQLRELIGEEKDDSATVTDPSQAEKTNKKKPRDYSKLYAKNHDFAGWLTVKDTVIDYPVMKSSEDEPEYYLHTDFDGYYSFSGCLFIGQGCNADSDSFVVYGHNMNNGSMFGGLDAYSDPDWALAHRDMIFETPTERRTYRVFAAFPSRVYAKDEQTFKYYTAVGDFTQEAYSDTIAHLTGMSVIDIGTAPPEEQTDIMMLSTCSYHTEDGRFVVAAYRIN